MPAPLTFRPKIFKYLKVYSADIFFSDLTAGLVVGIVALPLAIAFGIASGVSPEKGLITAVVAGFLVSALGGSRVQIGGPTGAFIVIVYGIVQKYGMEGLTVATLLAGILLILAGSAGVGSAIRFVPRAVVVGFTSGIALIIFSSQAKDALGLPIEKLPVEFIEKWKMILLHADSANMFALTLCLGTVLLVAFWGRFFKRIPGSLAAIVLSSAAVICWHLRVETIGSRFGELPHTLPMPHLPTFSLEMARALILPAFTIALLAGIESLLSAVVADGMIRSNHRSNTELIAQGIANIASALFGGIPATGAIARSATNIKNGARTPMAGRIHAFTLLAILLLFGKWARLIPFSCLAGILVVVSYHMSEWRSFKAFLSEGKPDALVMVVTFALTVLVDLTVAILAGIVLNEVLQKIRRTFP